MVENSISEPYFSRRWWLLVNDLIIQQNIIFFQNNLLLIISENKFIFTQFVSYHLAVTARP